MIVLKNVKDLPSEVLVTDIDKSASPSKIPVDSEHNLFLFQVSTEKVLEYNRNPSVLTFLPMGRKLSTDKNHSTLLIFTVISLKIGKSS